MTVRVARALAAAGLCALMVGATLPARADQTPLAGGADLAMMLDLEAKMADSMHYGHAVPVVFDSPEQLPGHVVAAPYWGDTALWSGVYLGGEAMRYAVARRHLADDPSSFWEQQRDEALARVRELLAAEHRDINIAEDWAGTLKVPPAVSADPNDAHNVDAGGGVIHGERGMVTRGCTPIDAGPLGINPPNHDPAHPINDHSNHVFQITWTHGDGVTYNCETSPSRDTYAGLTFGLLTAFDLVDDAGLRAQIRDDVLAMARFLVLHGWSHVRPHGYMGTHSDEDWVLSPLMPHVPMARLNIAAAARHVVKVLGTTQQKATWNAVWAEELASQGPLLGPSLEVDAMQPNEGYFKFNLHHLIAFNLFRTVTDEERLVLARGFSAVDTTTRDDINAHFEAITFAITGEAARRDGAITHLQQWRDYRAASTHVRNSAQCGTTITCVPQDRAGVVLPTGTTNWYPESAGSGLRAEGPLPVAVRPPADFLWQRPPTALDGDQDPSWREPGIDYLTPYWMLRYLTEVSPPALRPLPKWLGPAHV
jgi:hypothetical protein